MDNFSLLDKPLFLRNYWQKKPFLLKAAFSQAPSFINADELAGLSLEDDIESRIMIEKDDGCLTVQHGPFDESIFASLPESKWTLLVQSLDRHLPELCAWLTQFDFLPNWRFDDVMVSYASTQGGVGPHVDNYDVFLIQGKGKRRWRVGEMSSDSTQKTQINGLNYIENFESIIDVIMEPGDLLYIPPDTPHWGISIDESIGYSVGYRSSQNSHVFALLADYFTQHSDEQSFFTDKYRVNTNQTNQIEPELVNWAKKQLLEVAGDSDLLTKLLAKQLSISKIEPSFDANDSDHINASVPKVEMSEARKTLQLNFESNQLVELKHDVTANWYTDNVNIILNIEGESFSFPKTYSEYLMQFVGYRPITLKKLKNSSNIFDFEIFFTNLINKGYIRLKNEQ